MGTTRLEFFYRVGAPAVPRPRRRSGSSGRRAELDFRPFTDLAGLEHGPMDHRVALGQVVSLIRMMGGSADLYFDPDSLPDPNERALVALLLAAVDSRLVIGYGGTRTVHPEATPEIRDLERVCAARLPDRNLFAISEVGPFVLRKKLRLTGRESAKIANLVRGQDLTPTAVDYRARKSSEWVFPFLNDASKPASDKAPVETNDNLTDEKMLAKTLYLTAAFSANSISTWRPHNTAEGELLSAVQAAAGGSYRAGEPHRISDPHHLTVCRRLIPFAAKTLAWQYLNDIAPTNDLAKATALARDMHTAGQSLRPISDELTRLGFATKRGLGRWSASAVRTLFTTGGQPETSKE